MPSLDAETVAAYFQTLSGLPQNNVVSCEIGAPSGPTSKKRCSIGFQPKTTKDSLVVVYFAGQAMVNASGDTFPHSADGSLGSSTRLYP